MSDRVLKMVRERSSVSVHFLRFISLAKDGTKTVCFFEGEDQKYFVIRLNLSKLKSNWFGIDCEGKKNVLDLYSVVTTHETYKNSLVAFYIDRDFDEPISKHMRNLVYETPCYSVENLYCTEHCISQILDIEFKLSKNTSKPELAQEVLEHYRALLKQFHISVRPLNVWIKGHRTKEKIEGLKRLKLNNQALDQFVKVELNTVTSILPAEDFPSKFPDAHILSKEELQSADTSLPKDDQQLHFRGKYHLEFVRKYLENLKKACNDSKSPFHNPGCSVKLTLTKANLISELSQYATTPDCLNDFLNKLKQ